MMSMCVCVFSCDSAHFYLLNCNKIHFHILTHTHQSPRKTAFNHLIATHNCFATNNTTYHITFYWATEKLLFEAVCEIDLRNLSHLTRIATNITNVIGHMLSAIRIRYKGTINEIFMCFVFQRSFSICCTAYTHPIRWCSN